MKKGVALIVGLSFMMFFIAFFVIAIGSGDVGAWLFIPFMMPIVVFVFVGIMISRLAKK